MFTSYAEKSIAPLIRMNTVSRRNLWGWLNTVFNRFAPFSSVDNQYCQNYLYICLRPIHDAILCSIWNWFFFFWWSFINGINFAGSTRAESRKLVLTGLAPSGCSGAAPGSDGKTARPFWRTTIPFHSHREGIKLQKSTPLVRRSWTAASHTSVSFHLNIILPDVGFRMHWA